MTSTLQPRFTPEPFVIKRTDEGLKVYSPSAPTKVFLVNGTVDAPSCTCPEFNSELPCKHIQAVLQRAPVQGNGHGTTEAEKPTPPKNGKGRVTLKSEGERARMILKRSMSPDGKIDSLSVEFSCPMEDLDLEAVHAQATNVLVLQSAIIGTFLEATVKPVNGKNGHQQKEVEIESGNGSVPGKLLNIAGMNTRWGRRLFISVQVNGDQLKFFGSRQQLADAIAAAGYHSVEVEEGIKLDFPCRVVTKPSSDGKYLNVEQVLPAGQGQRVRA